MPELEDFRERFHFNPAFRGYVGVERKVFLTDFHGCPVSKSSDFLRVVNDPAWTHDFSACQVEHRTPRLPSDSRTLLFALEHGDLAGKEAAVKIGCRLLYREVAPEDMPLDVYPLELRYAEMRQRLVGVQLSAACRVAGTHLHFGMESLEDAIQRYNRLVPRVDELVRLGDHSEGRHTHLYQIMAGGSRPPIYRSAEHFHEQARARGFDQNPRNCWDMVRISIHGTVEVRCFGVTDNAREILEWVSVTRSLFGF